MRILTTGHEGYIGVVLVPILQQAGHKVVGFDSGLFRSSDFGPPPEPVQAIEKDIRDVEASDLEGIDAICHLAGLSNDPMGDLDPALTDAINCQGTLRLARLAREAGIERFVFSSSCSTYGLGGEDFLDETCGFNPVTPYGKSKVDAEAGLTELADDRFSPVYLRNATAYGFSCRHRFDLVVNNLVAWAYTTGEVFLKSSGEAWRPIVHIRDIARAFLAAVEAPRDAVHNQAFNIGRTDQNFRVHEIARAVASVVPGATVQLSNEAPKDTRCYRVNCEKAANALPGFQAEWTLEAGAREVFDAYKTLGLRLDEFEGPRYRRVDTLKEKMRAGSLGADLRRRNGSSIPATLLVGGHPAVQRAFPASTCLACGSTKREPIVDFGPTPLADRLRKPEQSEPELVVPLRLAFCPECSLVQIDHIVPPEILFGGDYPYFSSVSPALSAHFEKSAKAIIAERKIGAGSLVVEAASNDGYLLRHFKAVGATVRGIDPAEGPSKRANEIGVPTERGFFTEDYARDLRQREGRAADVFLANNVLAHVKDLNGFIRGIRTVIEPSGVAVIEAPYLRDLIEHREFDTIYHQHLCYFSVTALDATFRRQRLYLQRLERTPIHGGSLRLFLGTSDSPDESVTSLLKEERTLGMDKLAYYKDFQEHVQKVRDDLRKALIQIKARGKTIAAYGAAAKATTLLAYCGIDRSMIDFVADMNPYKHGLLMGGNRIPIRPPSALLEDKPDYTLLLAWNFREEILAQQAAYRGAGGRFIIPIPSLEIV